jgi:hypothetical protein
MRPAHGFPRAARIALATLLAGPPAARAQTLVGHVLDDLTGGPITTATVMLVDSADKVVSSTLSEADGRFLFDVAGPGTFRIYADRLGYEELISEAFPLAGVGPVEVQLYMQPQPLELDSLLVLVKARLSKLDRGGFYHRRGATAGTFFDAEDVKKWDPARLTDLLRLAAGVNVRPSRYGGTAVLSRRTGCPMKIVLDGFDVDALEFGSIDDWVDPSMVLGVEVYPGIGGMGAPARHRGSDANCGVIMIWTR